MHEKYNEYRAAVVQACVDDRIVSHPEHVHLRDIFPDKDLLDANGAKIQRDWQQPPSSTYTVENTDFVIYKTGPLVESSRKIILIYGIKNLSMTPTTTPSNEAWLMSMSFYTQSSKIGETGLNFDLQTYGMELQQPIMTRASQELTIQGQVRDGAIGKNDRLMFLGIVGAHGP
jgi:hypothetical protein